MFDSLDQEFSVIEHRNLDCFCKWVEDLFVVITFDIIEDAVSNHVKEMTNNVECNYVFSFLNKILTQI